MRQPYLYVHSDSIILYFMCVCVCVCVYVYVCSYIVIYTEKSKFFHKELQRIGK